MSHDCWSTIGVRGDRSCPELERHVHCRNCPVYAAAASALLEREPSAREIAAWTAHAARPKPVEEADRQAALLFRVGPEWLALSTEVVVEIGDLRPIHTLPHRRGGAILGVANVRGELLVCVALGRLLGQDGGDREAEAINRDARRRLLVLRRHDVRAACPVDEVYGIGRFHVRDLREVPSTVSKSTARHSRAVLPWQGRAVGVLDDHALFQTLQRSFA